MNQPGQWTGPGNWGPHVPEVPAVPPEHNYRRKERRTLPAALKIVIGSVVAIGLVLVGLAIPWVLPDEAPPMRWVGEHDILANRLTEAADGLRQVAGVKYTGSVTNAHGAEISLDIEVANEGSAYGTLVINGIEVEVMATPDHAFIWAQAAYWEAVGLDPYLIENYTSTWVRINRVGFGFEVLTTLAPVSLADLLEQSASTVESAEEVVDDGVSGRRLHTSLGIVTVSESAPYQILDIELQRVEGAQALDLAIEQLDAETVRALYERVRAEVGLLERALDLLLPVEFEGDEVVATCTYGSCSTPVIIENSVDDEYVDPNAYLTIYAVITVELLLDGVPVGSCEELWEMPLNTSAVMPCNAQIDAPYYIVAVLGVWRAVPVIGGHVNTLLDRLYEAEESNPGL